MLAAIEHWTTLLQKHSQINFQSDVQWFHLLSYKSIRTCIYYLPMVIQQKSHTFSTNEKKKVFSQVMRLKMLQVTRLGLA